MIFRSATADDFMNIWNNNNIDVFSIKTGEPKAAEVQLSIYGNGYIERKINATGYNDLSIQYELGYSLSWPMEPNDNCGLYIKQNAIKTYINQYYGINVPATIQLSYLPKLLDSNDDIYIGFDNNGSDTSDDRIYIPVVIFQGIVTNSPTNTPTKSPTNIPTFVPSVLISNDTTTLIPSENPTSIIPTIDVLIPIIIGCASLTLIFFALVGIYVCFKRKRKINLKNRSYSVPLIPNNIGICICDFLVNTILR